MLTCLARRRQGGKRQFVGTRRFSSSNQFCTRIRFDAVPPPASAWPLRMIRNRPSGAMSYGRLPPTARQHCEFEQHLRTPGDERRPGLHRDRKHLPTVQAAEEQFPAVTRPERETAAARRDLLPISELRIPLDVDLRSTGHVRTGRPSSVRLETRPRSRCRTRFSPASSRRTGARWRSARSRTAMSRHLGKQELSAVRRPAVGAQIEEIFRTREEPLVAAGAIRRPPEQLRVARSIRREDDALAVGRPERAACPMPGRSSAGSTLRGRHRRSRHRAAVASASRAPSGDTRTSRYESSGRPGSGEARPWRSTDTTVCWPPPAAPPGT